MLPRQLLAIKRQKFARVRLLEPQEHLQLAGNTVLGLQRGVRAPQVCLNPAGVQRDRDDVGVRLHLLMCLHSIGARCLAFTRSEPGGTRTSMLSAALLMQ